MLKYFFHDAVGSAVTVLVRQTQDPAVFIEESVVHAPSVDPYADYRIAITLGR